MESTVVKANVREVEANLSDQKESLKQTQMSCGLKLFQKVCLDGAGHKRAACTTSFRRYTPFDSALLSCLLNFLTLFLLVVRVTS